MKKWELETLNPGRLSPGLCDGLNIFDFIPREIESDWSWLRWESTWESLLKVGNYMDIFIKMLPRST